VKVVSLLWLIGSTSFWIASIILFIREWSVP
jgi:hypothetical protein